MTVTVSTVGDTTGEGDETLFLDIVGVTGPAMTGNTQTLLTIIDDDSKYLFILIIICHLLHILTHGVFKSIYLSTTHSRSAYNYLSLLTYSL